MPAGVNLPVTASLIGALPLPRSDGSAQSTTTVLQFQNSNVANDVCFSESGKLMSTAEMGRVAV
jgi:hypothetical protein